MYALYLNSDKITDRTVSHIIHTKCETSKQKKMTYYNIRKKHNYKNSIHTTEK